MALVLKPGDEVIVPTFTMHTHLKIEEQEFISQHIKLFFNK